MNEVYLKAERARFASRELNRLSADQKNQILSAMAEALLKHTPEIIAANTCDLDAGKKSGMSVALQDRLRLTEQRIHGMADGLREVAALPDPNGRILSETVRPNGLKIKKIAVPMGVIAMIYEARPNVTADAVGLCLKAGSAVVLRGGSDAIHSNTTIVKILRDVVSALNTNPEIIQLIESTERSLVGDLLICRKYIDLVIPRGGASLIQRVVEEATIPVIETGVGNCHVYVDASADLKKALPIALNSKIHRPSVCNAAETLLVHEAVAERFLPGMIAEYKKAGVIMHGCPITRQYDKTMLPATDDDYAREYLALEIAIKVVPSLAEAIAHINRFGTRHTETIVAEDKKAIDLFERDIDAAAVMVNASTRFTDGGEFGFGCEIGISTQKLHARGPMGLNEIMSYKYLVEGNGQVRS